MFAGKHGFITLRDLFRWADRKPSTYLELAEHGYMLLAERLRKADERHVILEVLEKHMKVKLDLDQMYSCRELSSYGKYRQREVDNCDARPTNIVWTKSMKRLFTLVSHCIEHKEPVLLVGETGCGKTTGMEWTGFVIS